MWAKKKKKKKKGRKKVGKKLACVLAHLSSIHDWKHWILIDLVSADTATVQTGQPLAAD